MKKFFALLATCMMLMGMSLTAFAGPSPTAEPVEPEEPAATEKPTSPKTGEESNVWAVTGMLTMCVCAGAVVVSLHKAK